MVVHISLFYLKNKDDAQLMIAALNQVPEDEPSIVSSYVGRNWFSPPPAPGLPDFADVAQVIMFETQADAAAYAECSAHTTLRATTDHLIARVAAAEFVQD